MTTPNYISPEGRSHVTQRVVDFGDWISSQLETLKITEPQGA
jgi:hypothetical protein